MTPLTVHIANITPPRKRRCDWALACLVALGSFIIGCGVGAIFMQMVGQ